MARTMSRGVYVCKPLHLEGTTPNVQNRTLRNRSSLSVPYFHLGPPFNEGIVLLATVENDQKKGLWPATGLCPVLSDTCANSFEDTVDSKIEGACVFFGECARIH